MWILYFCYLLDSSVVAISEAPTHTFNDEAKCEEMATSYMRENLFEDVSPSILPMCVEISRPMPKASLDSVIRHIEGR